MQDYKQFVVSVPTSFRPKFGAAKWVEYTLGRSYQRTFYNKARSEAVNELIQENRDRFNDLMAEITSSMDIAHIHVTES